METIIEVGYKEEVFDAIGEGIKKDILDLGIKGVKDVLTHQLYLIEGTLAEKGLRFIAEHILCDPVTQYYKIIPKPQKKKSKSSDGHFAVEVWFKKGVTDNVGASVEKAVEDLELKGVSEVRSGRKVIMKGRLKKPEVINITTRLLANEVVEEYKIYGEK